MSYGVKQWVLIVSTILFFSVFLHTQAESQKGEKKLMVEKGMEVSIEYTLSLEGEGVVDSNVGRDPLVYIHGNRQIIPGLEKALEGMMIGGTKKVTVKPEDGYGPVNKEAFLEVRKDQIDADSLKVGATLQSRDQQGRIIFARISEIKDQTVVLDFNHPLAGKTLYFDIKILNIRDKQNK
jgi:FKBP-type peptidyl-prolyl cis-trans isomerase SlyD